MKHRYCSICGAPIPPGATMDDLVDLGWAALQEGRGPRYYFCPDHTALSIVSWFSENSKIGKALRGRRP